MTDHPERILNDGKVRGVNPSIHEQNPELIGKGRWRTERALETETNTSLPNPEPNIQTINAEQLRRSQDNIINEQVKSLDEQQPDK